MKRCRKVWHSSRYWRRAEKVFEEGKVRPVRETFKEIRKKAKEIQERLLR